MYSRSFDRLADAKTFKAETERRSQLGALYTAPKVSFGAYADQWLDNWKAKRRPSVSQTDSVTRNLTMHLRPLRGLLIEQITAAEFDRVIVGVATKRPRTAQHAFEAGRRVLRHAKENGQRVDEGIFALERNKYEEREPVFLTWLEVQALAGHSSEACLIEFAALTGLRLGELAALEEKDVDVARGVVRVTRSGYRGETVQRTKTKSSVRAVPLSESARKILAEQLLSRPAGTAYVFPAEDGGQWTKRGLHRRFTLAARRFGRPEMHFHDLRHTFVSLMAAAGVMPGTVAALVGHKDGGVLVQRRYQHLFPSAQAHAAGALDAFLATDVPSEFHDQQAV
jgi:integrase